jgi:hypothetical protein
MAHVLNRRSYFEEEDPVRILSIAAITAALATPSVGYSQENGPVGGRIGANGEPTFGTPSASSSTSPYGTPPSTSPYGRQSFIGYPVRQRPPPIW